VLPAVGAHGGGTRKRYGIGVMRTNARACLLVEVRGWSVHVTCEEGVVHAAPQACEHPKTVERAVLAASIVGSSMTFIDGTVVNVALPVLRRQLKATAAEVQWVVEAYMLLLASMILVGGALGDRWGRRKVFVGGALLFAAASAWCGMAPSAGQLILARGAQGLGAALLVPGSLALISATFARERRGRAIGTWAAWTSITAGFGPILGGWLVERISWRWIFFMNLPLAALVVVIAWWRVPESRDESARSIDWTGAALATAGLFGLVWGLIEGGSAGFAQPGVLVSLGLGAALLVAFVLAQQRARHPMVPAALFRSRTFTGANVLTLFLYAALGATTFVLPFNLIESHGYSVVQAAAAQLPFVAVMFLLSRWSGGLLDRHGPRLPLTVGPMIAAVGFALFAVAARSGAYWTAVFPAMMAMSLGITISVAPLTTAVMTSVADRQAGVASGINNAVSRLAILLAVAIAGALSAGSLQDGLARVAWLSALLAIAGGVSARLLVQPGRAPRAAHSAV
jgi:EmrB/QacA subfamily drug resistance transporter